METATSPSTKSRVTLDDLNKHNTKADCWIAVHSKVWDITEFIDYHPGGAAGTPWAVVELSKSCSLMRSEQFC